MPQEAITEPDRSMGAYGYIFLKICDMSFKGPRGLRLILDEARERNGGELRNVIGKGEQLELLLREQLQSVIDGENCYYDDASNARMSAVYQGHLERLCERANPEHFGPNLGEYHCFRYLDWIKEEKDCNYFPEPLLNLMTLAIYNLETSEK